MVQAPLLESEGAGIGGGTKWLPNVLLVGDRFGWASGGSRRGVSVRLSHSTG